VYVYFNIFNRGVLFKIFLLHGLVYEHLEINKTRKIFLLVFLVWIWKLIFFSKEQNPPYDFSLFCALLPFSSSLISFFQLSLKSNNFKKNSITLVQFEAIQIFYF